MLGCLFGYVSGGILGRVLDKALGVVERRVDRRSPARFVAGTLGAIAGSTLALVLVLAGGVAGAGSDRGVAGRPRVVDLRLRRLPHRRPPERSSARTARSVDPAAGASPTVRCARRPARRLVGRHGRPAVAVDTSGCAERRPDGCPVRARRGAGICRRQRRREAPSRAAAGSRSSTRCAKRDTCGSTCSTTRSPRSRTSTRS